MLNGNNKIDLKKLFIKLFINTKLSEKEYEINSQKNIMISNVLTSLIYTLMTGTFIAGYATFLGASDSFIGIISVIPVVTAVIQLFVPLLFERIKEKDNFNLIIQSIFIFSFKCNFHTKYY
jgi:hypothetical protein